MLMLVLALAGNLLGCGGSMRSGVGEKERQAPMALRGVSGMRAPRMLMCIRERKQCRVLMLERELWIYAAWIAECVGASKVLGLSE